MIDVLITTFNRVHFLRKTVESFREKNRSIPYRLFIIDDCSTDGTKEYLFSLTGFEGQIVVSQRRLGVVYGFNLLWTIAEFYDRFTEEFPFMCYLQDDVESVADEWLLTLLEKFEEYGESENVGFVSGYDAPEHPIYRAIDGVFLKKSTSFQNVLAPKSYWRNIGLVPKLNPDGSSRGFPNDGRGSHIDLYFTGCMSGSVFVERASAQNSSFKEKRSVLVVPGLLRHLGADEEDSTWRKGCGKRIG